MVLALEQCQPDRAADPVARPQIAARDADVGVAGRISDLGQRSAAGQCMANERVQAVTDRQRLDASGAENAARRAKAFSTRA